VEQGFRVLCVRIDRAVALEGSGPEAMIERIVAMGRAYVEFACDHPAHYRIMFRPELVNPENCPGAQEEGTNAFMRVQKLVHEAVQAGLPAHPSEDALVAFLWSVGHGLAYLLLDGPLATKMPAARDAQIGVVLGQVRAYLHASLQVAAISGKDKGVARKRAPRR
jgi:AcrR family transcriptional regulator